ncbi:MAG TPA: c-type cytochrome biogenesis protein CcmI [Rhizomicrobium sp.]|nr:c-type cytochrome biogenesis protein CcmI [Rhizomicrobium sp.]
MILTVLTSIAVAGLTIPLVRRQDTAASRESNVAILKRQLSEIDAQHKSGAVTAEEAEGMRSEIKRRILAEGRVQEGMTRVLDAKTLPWVAVAVAGVVALAATGLYALIGRPDVPSSSAATAAASQDANVAGHPIADVAAMIGQLETKLRANPNDPEGWRMLGWSYSATGRPADAAQAYARAAALDPKNGDYPSAEGDALVNAAQGQVTPDALAAFQAALKIDSNDPRARYYMGLYEDQQGQHDKAVADWIALIKSAPPGAPWAQQVRDFVERTARERHIDISGKLPPVAPTPAPAVPATPSADQSAQAGPSPDQVAAAGQMQPQDREAMIHQMVDRLAGELKTNPHDADGWMRLMRARMVLGETDKAAAAYHDARDAFANSPTDLDALQKAAQSLGIPGA